MNLLKYFILMIITLFSFIGCTNPNSISIGKIEDKKIVPYKEEKYKEVLFEKIKKIKSEEALKYNLLLQSQICISKLYQTGESTFLEERFSRSWWVDIQDDKISLEYNLRNIIQYKNAKETREEIILGGSYGNKQLRILLPYEIKKIEENKYNFILMNSDNIEIIESFNILDKKIYEHPGLSMTKEEYKESVLKIVNCIQEYND